MADIGESIELLYKLNREAHENIQDLRALIREAREHKAEVEKMVSDSIESMHQTVDELIGRTVADGLDAYNKRIMEAMEESADAVQARFDSLANILLGEVRPGENLETLLRGWLRNRSTPTVRRSPGSGRLSEEI